MRHTVSMEMIGNVRDSTSKPKARDKKKRKKKKKEKEVRSVH